MLNIYLVDLQMSSHISTLRELFAAVLALVWFLTSVPPNVYLESA